MVTPGLVWLRHPLNMFHRKYLSVLLALVILAVAATWHVEAFVANPPLVGRSVTTMALPKMTPLAMAPVTEPSSMTMAAATVDPTSFLTDVFGSVLGTPLILAIPIVAALGVAGLVVFLIVSYANPAEPDE